MRATNTNPTVMIRLPNPLYRYLTEMMEQEGATELFITTLDEKQRQRNYRLVPTSQKQEGRLQKHDSTQSAH